MSTIPDDENGQVLRRMRDNGDDLTEDRNINFHFIFAARSQAIRFLELLADKSLTVAICWYEERDAWECTVTKYMVPTHSAITELENYLIDLAQPLEGTPDGWGCFEAK